MDSEKKRETLDYVLSHPEDVLSELGTAKTSALLRELSELPSAAEKIQNSKIVKLMEIGRKYITGKIIMEDANHE